MGKLVHGGKVYAQVNEEGTQILKGTTIPQNNQGKNGQIYLRNLLIPTGVDIRASISNSAVGDYFDTGYLFNENTRIEAKFKIPSSVSSYNTPFGCRISTSIGNEPHQLFFTLNNTSLYFAFGGTQSLTNDFFTYNSDAVVEVLGSVLKMQQNSNIKYAKAEPYSTSGTKNLYLFCANADGSPWSASYCVMTLYYFKIYESDDLVHYFLPCVDGNSEPCLYDAVTGDYLYNQGSGTLTVGSSETPVDEIISSFAKVNGSWQKLIGTDIEDITNAEESENAIVKQGTFVSATSQYGIVDVDCGFKPDMVMVKLPFGNNDTTSYWEKSMSWAETNAIWNLYPAERNAYVVDLGRQSGETGIQAINDDGFSFMSNGANTRGVTCEYIAVKY